MKKKTFLKSLEKKQVVTSTKNQISVTNYLGKNIQRLLRMQKAEQTGTFDIEQKKRQKTKFQERESKCKLYTNFDPYFRNYEKMILKITI